MELCFVLMPVAKTEVLSKYTLMKRKGIISHVGKCLVCAEQGLCLMQDGCSRYSCDWEMSCLIEKYCDSCDVRALVDFFLASWF